MLSPPPENANGQSTALDTATEALIQRWRDANA